MDRVREPETLALVALRGIVIFPNTAVTFDVGRPASVAAVEKALAGDSRVFVTAQKDASVDKPGEDDLYGVGTVIRIRQTLKMPDDTVRVLAEGECRGRIASFTDAGVYASADVVCLREEGSGAPRPEATAQLHVIRELAERLAREKERAQGEFLQLLRGERDLGALCDIAAGNLLDGVAAKQGILEAYDPELRARLTTEALAGEIGITELEKRIRQKVQEAIDNTNHEYYLREQIHAMQKELGDDEDEDVRGLRRRIAQSNMPEDARRAAEKELSRLARTAINTPESGVSMNYLEFMLDLPWKKHSGGTVSVEKARRVLERDHYGMKDVKERVLEHLAVMELDRGIKSPVICLVGPPGVGDRKSVV